MNLDIIAMATISSVAKANTSV